MAALSAVANPGLAIALITSMTYYNMLPENQCSHRKNGAQRNTRGVKENEDNGDVGS